MGEPMNYPTQEQMKLIVQSNGWTTLWSPDYWIKSEWLAPKSGVNVDWAGMSLVHAYERVMEQLDADKPKPESEKVKQKRWF